MRVPDMGPATVTDLTESAQPRRSFEDFYSTSRERIARALALTLGSIELGTEAADEGLTRAYQSWDRISGYENIEGWVYRVGLNWARSLWRKRRREAGDVFSDPTTEDNVGDIDLEAALKRLDMRFRAVVVLRLYLDWSVEQTARALSISPGTVKSRMSRALDRLESDLGGER